MHVTYWGDLTAGSLDESRNFLASHPVWESALSIIAIFAGLAIASLALFFIVRFATRRLRHASPKLKRRVSVYIVILLLYAGLYLGTTQVRPQGYGGLSGPLRVRVFQNEKHLIAFYPLYLVERWIRNGSFTSAVYYFNIEFKNGRYPHPWLYNDGAYGRIWYDF